MKTSLSAIHTGRRLHTLDGLRAVAILVVLWHNCTAGLYRGDSLIKIINLLSNAGWIGVELFFVLSGFLITGILLDSEKTSQQFSNFYVRRVLRIFPPYYTLLITILVILPVVLSQPSPLASNFTQTIFYWFFLNNWSSPLIGGTPALSHLWSLAVEEQFYLLWPACVFFLSKETLLKLCIGAILTALIARLGLTLYDIDFAKDAAYEFTIARWDALAAGAVLAIIIRSEQRQELLYKYWRPTLYLSGIYMIAFTALDRNFAPVGPGLTFLNQTVSALLFAATIFWAVTVEHNSRGRSFLLHPAMQSIGKYSYAMYLFHMPIIRMLESPWTKHTLNFAAQHPALWITVFALLVFILTYVLAAISWRIIEQPCLKLKRFFSSRSSAANAT